MICIITACQSNTHTLNLALLGDLMLGRGVDPTPGSLAYLKPELDRADLALANLESPLAEVLPATTSTYNLCAPANRAKLLQDWGMDILSITNNHSFDCSPGGTYGTRSILESNGIAALEPGFQPVYREINGLRLAFFAFDDISSTLNVDAALQSIRMARSTNSLVIVSIHWGMEYQGGASNRQKFLARQFATAGAALIWGHHPHVLQPAEWIGTPQGKTLVLYSLGNALFDQGGLAATRQSALVVVTMDAGGAVSVLSVPFEIDTAASQVVQPDASTSANIKRMLNIP